ncbi:hypothetical protein ACFSQE_15430 [Vogesella fluminis]|uniref:hypothetical protein n=1 Tax=Vogesella fluminis TaxID=1069161 RepID=UPI001679422F|nr:hypothetical protein [Vogesella fluminis]
MGLIGIGAAAGRLPALITWADWNVGRSHRKQHSGLNIWMHEIAGPALRGHTLPAHCGVARSLHCIQQCVAAAAKRP